MPKVQELRHGRDLIEDRSLHADGAHVAADGVGIEALRERGLDCVERAAAAAVPNVEHNPTFLCLPYRVRHRSFCAHDAAPLPECVRYHVSGAKVPRQGLQGRLDVAHVHHDEAAEHLRRGYGALQGVELVVQENRVVRETYLDA